MAGLSLRSAFQGAFGTDQPPLSEGLGGLHPFYKSLKATGVGSPPHVTTRRDVLPYHSLRAIASGLDWPRHNPPFRPTQASDHDYPKDREPGWSEELQGVTHDVAHWYFAQKQRLLRFAVTSDINADLDEVPHLEVRLPEHDVDGLVLGPGRSDTWPFLEAGRYHHFGDLDCFGGHLFVPLESELDPPLPPKVLVFDTDLQHIATANLDQQASAPWCAINPLTGILYSSEFNAAQLTVYRPFLDGERFTLQPLGRFDLRSRDGSPNRRLDRMQGGAFSENGHLYLVSDFGRFGGVFGFDMLTGREMSHLPVDYQATIDFGFGVAPWPKQELEGLTLWDVDAVTAPGIHGQVHLIMIDNSGSGDDDLYFKHYEAWDSADICRL